MKIKYFKVCVTLCPNLYQIACGHLRKWLTFEQT